METAPDKAPRKISPARWLLDKLMYLMGVLAIGAPFGVVAYIFAHRSDVISSPMGMLVVVFWSSFPLIAVYAFFAFLAIILNTELEQILATVDVLSVRLIRSHFYKSCFGFIVLTISVVVYCLMRNDWRALIALPVYAFVNFSYNALALLRVRYGWFGGNAREVADMLDYLYSLECKSSGRPPRIRRVLPGFVELRASLHKQVSASNRKPRGVNG